MKKTKSEFSLQIAAYIITFVMVTIIALPLLWTFSSSMKQTKDIYKVPPSFLPSIPRQVKLYVDYTSHVDTYSVDELQDIIKKDSMMMIYGIKKDLNKDEFDNNIFKYDFYGIIDDKVVFHTGGGEFKVNYATGYMGGRAYQAHNVEKYYNDLLDYLGYRLDYDGIGRRIKIDAPSTIEFDGNLQEWIDGNGRFVVLGDLRGYSLDRYILGWAQNYIAGWEELKSENNKFGFGLYFFNSIIISISNILGVVIVGALAGYALSRLFPQRVSKVVLLFYLLTMMLPWFTTLIPTYLLIRDFNLMGSRLSMILPNLASGFVIYIFKGFFDKLPGDLFACARVDGAKELTVFFKICLPLSSPVIGFVVLTTFFGIWNEFMWSNIVTIGNDSIAPFNVMLQRSIGQLTVGGRYALSIIACIPTIILFGVFQKSIEKGVVWSGIKG